MMCYISSIIASPVWPSNLPCVPSYSAVCTCPPLYMTPIKTGLSFLSLFASKHSRRIEKLDLGHFLLLRVILYLTSIETVNPPNRRTSLP